MVFEKCDSPETYRLRCQKRPEIWGEVEITPFTAEEAEFLDALYDEFRELNYGPCLHVLTERQLEHGYMLDLIARRRHELPRTRSRMASAPPTRTCLYLAGRRNVRWPFRSRTQPELVLREAPELGATVEPGLDPVNT